MEKKLDILCFGEPLFEFNQRTDGNYEPGYGGDVSNCAIAAARCGAKVGMFAHIGADHFGHSFMRLWQQEGIDVDAVVQKEDLDTGVYFVSHDADGHHYSYLRRHSAATQVAASDIYEDVIARARILHVSAISQAISESATGAVEHAINLANKTGALVSFDTNLRLKLWTLENARRVIHAVLPSCDIVLPGFDDATLLTGFSEPDKIVDFYLDFGCKVVALTLGDKGVLVASQKHREKLPAFSIDFLDANGAGDTFDGAFLSHYVESQDAFDAARFANAAAALSTTRSGAVRSMPQRDKILEMLASQ